ncbi:MAG TPA: AAA family ATPase [Aliidongia sp.]|nr:AAA family ATPase [Aliidongia sp.]
MSVSPEPIGVTAGATKSARVFAVVNQKGGVGKTTTAVNLATALAAAEKRVLLIDIDPQGNASTGLGITRQQRVVTTYDVLVGSEELGAALVSTSVPGLQMVPASTDLAGAEIELVGMDRREYRLRDALSRLRIVYDYVLVDCPPSLGLLTLNAMVAANAVMVPLQCEFYALEGLSHLVKTIDRVKKHLNPGLDIQGVVLTMFDKRNNLCDLVATDVRGYFGQKVYNTVIPRNVRTSEAPSHGKPVLLYDWRCAGAQAYIHLASEVLYREQDYAQ